MKLFELGFCESLPLQFLATFVDSSDPEVQALEVGEWFWWTTPS